MYEACLRAAFYSSTRIIRTLVSRPEIFLRVATIPPDTVHTYDALFYLVDSAFDLRTNTKTLSSIRKTVVFVNGRAAYSTALEAV